MRVVLSLCVLLGFALAPAALGGNDATPRGAFTCDFGLPTDMDLSIVAPQIEIDRMYMAARPGMVHKLIPIIPDPLANEIHSGGRYLFDTHANAVGYNDWVRNEFVIEGTPFLEREFFLHPDCRAWETLGVAEFADVREHQVAMRTERFALHEDVTRADVAAQLSPLAHEAHERGLSAVWLLYDPVAHDASVVAFADRVVPATVVAIDPGALGYLLALPPLGDSMTHDLGGRTFDRAQWTLSVWLPFELGDQGEPSPWPNSPPLPAPSIGDGVCEVSRGESHANAPEDCRPHCGDGIWDADETWRDCPGDVRLFG